MQKTKNISSLISTAVLKSLTGLKGQALVVFIFSSFYCFAAFSTDSSVGTSTSPVKQPYLDKLLEKDALEGNDSLMKLPRSQKPLVTEPDEMQPYIESLKKEDKKNSEEVNAPNSAVSQPYIDKLLNGDDKKKEDRSADNQQPYIDSLKAGKELEPKKAGTVKNTAQIGLLVSSSFQLSAGSKQANSFESIYHPEKKFNPGFDLSFERQILRHPVIGAFGPHMRIDGLFFKGIGRFQRNGVESETRFSFMAIPVGAGIGYRAIQPRLVVPYAQLGIMAIPFMETRDDNQDSRKGLSSSYNFVAGLQLSLDWIGRKDTWDRYDAYGILHTYLSAQYMMVRPVSGQVQFKMELFFVGFGFEF